MVYQVISLVGAILILVAFAANQFEKLARETVAYQLLNLLGGICLCITAVAARQYGFILLEGAWVLVSTFGLFNIKR